MVKRYNKDPGGWAPQWKYAIIVNKLYSLRIDTGLQYSILV